MVGLRELANNLVPDALISGDSSQVPGSGEKKRKQKCCGTGFRAGLKSIVMQQPAPDAGKCVFQFCFFFGLRVELMLDAVNRQIKPCYH